MDAFKRYCIATLGQCIDKPVFNPRSFGNVNDHSDLLRNYGLPSNLKHDTIDRSNLLSVIAECKLFCKASQRNIWQLAERARYIHDKLYGHIIPTLQIEATIQLQPRQQPIPFSDILDTFDRLST
jgi:hypothetical protein